MRSYDIVKKCQDLTHLTWDERTVTSGTAGTFLKARTSNSAGNTYFKLSCYDRYRGIYGHECINELIASRLLDMLNIPHVPYRLVHATVLVDGQEYETWLSESRDYRKQTERRQAFDTYFSLSTTANTSPLDFCAEKGWQNQIFQMMAFDFLIANRDRHGANLEVSLSNSNTPSLSPLFDHGISLIFSCYENEAQAQQFDVMQDIQANNFIGSRSLRDNLRFIPQSIISFKLEDFTRELILANLDDVLPQTHLDKIWELLECRMGQLIDLHIVESE